MSMNSVVTIDGHKYAVSANTYIRKWQRQFTPTLSANIVELNFIDRGPGIKVYSFTLLLKQWKVGDLPYTQGCTETFEQQRANLDASFLKVATPLQFLDAFGEAPTLGGVYFTAYNQIIPSYGTSRDPYINAEIEITEAKKAIG